MARRRPPTVHGIAVVDKPSGVTSHDVVGMLRRRFGERRVGHAGTLDPSATGVLVVGFGHVTRLLRFVVDGRKSYTGDVVIGVETDSLDAEGIVTAVHRIEPIDLDDARRVVAAQLLGAIEQVPPMVSALKVDGRRLHELAREGVEIERAPRPVRVDRFDVVGSSADPDGRPVLRIEVDCSAGTYVRTLAADLGRLLGSGAHLRNLRRTAVEPFDIEEAAPPDECELLPPVEAVRALDKVVVDGPTERAIAVGTVLPRPTGDGPWAMVADDDRLLAVYERHHPGAAKPAVVIPVVGG